MKYLLVLFAALAAAAMGVSHSPSGDYGLLQVGNMVDSSQMLVAEPVAVATEPVAAPAPAPAPAPTTVAAPVDATVAAAPAPAPAVASGLAAPAGTILDPFVPTVHTANNTISYPNGTTYSLGSPEGLVALNVTKCFGLACSNGGICNHGVCACPEGFFGSRCEMDRCTGVTCPLGHNCKQGVCQIDLCYRVHCRNDGICDRGHCNCVNGFQGAFCQVDPCSQIQCQNGGICKNPGQCHCLNGFSGSLCEFNACANVQCQNGGKCLYGKCLCPADYEGEFCSIPTEAKKDQDVFSHQIGALEDRVKSMLEEISAVSNNANPRNISRAFRDMFRHYAREDIAEARRKNREDWKTPQVRGLVPVTRAKLAMPNTPYENAKIYEDQTLAYHLGHEIKSKKLLDAVKLLNTTDENLKYRKEVVAKDVPGAEHISTPFGTFTELTMTEKYVGQDASMLEADLATYRADKARAALDSEDLLL